MRRIFLLAAALLAGGTAVAVEAPAPATAACARIPGDFDADGHADVILGQAERAVSDIEQAGAVSIVRGAASGLTTIGNRFVDQQHIGGVLESQAFMGYASTTGYFNDDCYADAAIGVPNYHSQVGAIVVFYGAATGLDTEAPQLILTADHAARGLGSALATGDFNGDGRDDIGAGAPSSKSLAGRIYEFFGSATGVTPADVEFFTEDSPGVPGSLGELDFFGSSVAAGDFNGDHRADLAVGAPGETVHGAEQAGSVTVLPGSASGLTGTGSTVLTQHTAGVPGTAEPVDHFGTALAAGDVTGDGCAELLIGDAIESIGHIDDAGTVTVLKGGAGGITVSGVELWSQNSFGVPGTAEPDDGFGASLAVGDFNGDGHADAAIGVPGEDLGHAVDAGTVDVLYGRASDLTATGAQAWSQDSAGIPGNAEKRDSLGETLQAVRLAGGARAALVIGVPGEDSAGFTDNGAVTVLPGGPHGLTAVGSQFLDAHGLGAGAQNGARLGGL